MNSDDELFLKSFLHFFLVRLQLKKKISFKMKYMKLASTWADRLGLGKARQYGYSFSGGIQMYRAIGVPEFDNSNTLIIMRFDQRPKNF